MSVEKKLENMDEFGIDCGIITPTLSILLPTVNRPRYAVALAEAYNRYIFDRFAVGNDRLKVTLTVAPHKPERAAAEIEKHADKEDVVGIQMSATGLVPPPGARKYDPIYRAAEDNNLPLLFHSGLNTADGFPVISRTANYYVEEHAVNHPFSHMWNLTTMIFRGVPERFPDLDIVFQEAGIGVMVVNGNFGCGSSREHAPQALLRWGIDVIVGESFAEIFSGNCLALGIPTVAADAETIDHLQEWIEDHPRDDIMINVADETVIYGEHTASVTIDNVQYEALVDGTWDMTALLRSNSDAIEQTVAQLPYVPQR